MTQVVAEESRSEFVSLHYRLTRCLDELQREGADVHDDDALRSVQLRRLGRLRMRAIAMLRQAEGQARPRRAQASVVTCMTGQSVPEADAMSTLRIDVQAATTTLQSCMCGCGRTQSTAVLNAALPLACIGATASRVSDDLTATVVQPALALRARSSVATLAAVPTTDAVAAQAEHRKTAVLVADDDKPRGSVPLQCGPLRRERFTAATHHTPLASSPAPDTQQTRAVRAGATAVRGTGSTPSHGAEDVVVEEIKQAIQQMKTGVLRVSALMQQEEPALQRSNALLSDELVRTQRGARQLGQLSAVASTARVPRLLCCVPGAKLLWQSVLGPLWGVLRQALVLATIVALTAIVSLIVFATHKPHLYRVRA